VSDASTAARRRRRPRQPRPRLRTVRFALSDEELAELDAAAGHAGLARGAYAARAAMRAARGAGPAAGNGGDLLRDALSELIRAAGQVRRIGVNLNQAVARMHATGQPAGDLPACAAESIARARHLDDVAERVRHCLP